jgi:preprotein translocase subunit SecG
MLEIALLVVSILLIAIVLLQSSKASDASQIIGGGNNALFQNQKERGVELFITRLTIVLGAAFFIISFVMFVS